MDIATTPWALSGLMCLPSGALGRCPVQSKHQWLAGTIDVGIQDAHPGALRGPGQGQIRGDGGLAHPALTRGHRDNILDPR